ncbi:predicted protein [Phaeodactylum tricornutum CCAP 1055/1]|uniref:Guanylate cyclase domain-containing protein n=3 Tax=Phaeodactylum tricornutum TaxID=2850 RepID=B7G8I8_PHATC|nr:predicted protein [Phaeodactylum tricornutum CCAP 1055/1]EEC45052.1 predicted protein [Phaeodactylum tricornutum CCAP 1055/1]|eukprot:XP_002183352.1 predicted protein [Phaeodactylum tricornutum CCAP 1055/1]
MKDKVTGAASENGDEPNSNTGKGTNKPKRPSPTNFGRSSRHASHPSRGGGAQRRVSLYESSSSAISALSGSTGDDDDDDFDFSHIAPLGRSKGERTISTTIRLSKQGFRHKRTDNFAVQSIRRGSEDWKNLIKPFVADLVFRSLICRRFQSEVSFRPYTAHAAVLFIDLSSYSKITTAIAHRGAHALSSIVNAYLSRLLQFVHSHGGDVVKFAGDAVLVVWEGEQSDLAMNVLCAARCALEMQKTAGSHPIDGSSMIFQIHCGLSCGRIESEIFDAPTHVNMQRYYHAVSGEALLEISELVDLACAGEICASEACLGLLGSHGRYRIIDLAKQTEVGKFGMGKILTHLDVEESLSNEMELHIESTLMDRMARRNKHIEENFIHPSVIRQLNHGGLSPTQIAQMRSLCVLFIAMTSHGSAVNWLMEVQGVLDKYRCPIVQIIDDDKGVHVTAAINLYEAVPEASILGLDLCKELVDKHVGCAIGMAAGATFCGVTGSSSIACRWDITGGPPVRAARLMQFGMQFGHEVVLDQSIYDDPVAAVRMVALNAGIYIKGTDGVSPIYTLSESTDYSAFRVLETVHGAVHDDVVRKIQKMINGESTRCACLVTGPTLSGKKIVCQRAAGYADLVPYLHVCEENSGLLQLAKTMATWFKYLDDDVVKRGAKDVLDYLEKGHWTRAHDECVRLVTLIIDKGMNACFVVDRIQFLDEFSFSLIRECLRGRAKVDRLSSRLSVGSESSDGNATGRICFLCTHVPLYNWMSATDIVEHIARSHQRIRIPILTVAQTDIESLRTMFRDLADMNVSDRWLTTYAQGSGYCAGYFVERSAASRILSAQLWNEGKPGYAVTTEDITLYIPPGLMGKNLHMTVQQTSAEIVMRFSQVFDELPPLFQTLAKILTIATRRKFFKLPRTILWEVLNDLVSEGVDSEPMAAVLNELVDMFLLKIEQVKNEEVVSFLNPAFLDIIIDVCTPVQIRSIATALIERLEPILKRDFRIPLVIATLHGMLGQLESMQRHMWSEGFKVLLQEGKDWPESERMRWCELIQDEISAAGFNVNEILAGQALCQIPAKKAISHRLPMLKIYQGPITIGPMSHALGVLFTNIFHEYGVFHGARKSSVCRLRRSMASSSSRYLRQMECLENFLDGYGLSISREEKEREREIITALAKPASREEDAVAKAFVVLDDYIPQFIEPRMERLYSLVAKLREEGIPEVVMNAQPAIRRAYEALQVPKNRNDAAQDALMTLATLNWKPKPVPEQLCLIYYQTVARLRNKVLKRLTPKQLVGFRHQQSVDDLEAFLVVTPLLYRLQAKNLQGMKRSTSTDFYE